MITDHDLIDKYYLMLVERNPGYEGVFFAGIKTTGVFCRPTCPARKPHKKNCEFFYTAQEALLAGYRPCKRCKPLSMSFDLCDEVKKLVEAVEKEPHKKWTDKDFDELSISANTARRQFKKKFGMTFIEYARARRLGIAFNCIRNGDPVIDAQLESLYESANGFRDAFSKIMGVIPSKAANIDVMQSSWLETPLGAMLAIANDKELFLLEFVDRRGLETEIMNLRKKYKAITLPGRNKIIEQLEKELMSYFSGEDIVFKTPLALTGTDFQKQIWKELAKIPIGTTISYKELAVRYGKPSACRAVAGANGANQIAIIIPCHRVVGSNGDLTGYGGGIQRKKWLIAHEKNIKRFSQEKYEPK